MSKEVFDALKGVPFENILDYAQDDYYSLDTHQIITIKGISPSIHYKKNLHLCTKDDYIWENIKRLDTQIKYKMDSENISYKKATLKIYHDYKQSTCIYL